MIAVVLSSLVLIHTLSGAHRAVSGGPEGLGWEFLNDPLLGSAWEPVVGPSSDVSVVDRLCGLSGQTCPVFPFR